MSKHRFSTRGISSQLSQLHCGCAKRRKSGSHPIDYEFVGPFKDEASYDWGTKTTKLQDCSYGASVFDEKSTLLHTGPFVMKPHAPQLASSAAIAVVFLLGAVFMLPSFGHRNVSLMESEMKRMQAKRRPRTVRIRCNQNGFGT